MSLYDLLGIPSSADAAEITKAYKKSAMKHHPDKGGDPEEFKKIQHAYEVLSDERKKQVYDMTGSEEGEMMGGGMGGGGGMPFGMGGIPFDLGSMFGGMFGMGGPGPQMRGVRVKRAKAPPKTHDLPLNLHDFYHGRTLEVKFEKQKFCDACKGEGATSWQTCSPCQGRGIVRQVMMMGPIQMVNEGPCNECQGEGKKPSGACYMCSGKKTKLQEKTLQVKIEPGMKVGEVLLFANESSDDPNYMEAGDVQFVLQEADGDYGWTRKGDDLETQVELTLGDSLLGCTKTLKGHPGYSSGLEIQVPPGFTNGEVLTVKDKGMMKRGGGVGTLHCKLHIRVTDKDRERLKQHESVLKAIFVSTI